MKMVDVDKCSITHYPSGVLGRRAEEVEKIDDNIRQLIKKMTEIMRQQGGVGLAAPQAGVGLRIFIISLDPSKDDVRVYINPTVTQTGTLEAIEEGCLSVPGIYTKIRRSKNCRVTAMDLDGRKFTEEAEGLMARCLQHEYDHIEGMTIADKMGQTGRIVHRKKLKRLRENFEESQRGEG